MVDSSSSVADPNPAAEVAAVPRASLTGSPRLSHRQAELVPACLVVLAAVTLLFTRLILIDQGFWGDEVYSVVNYISGGPSAIFGGVSYVPNDHMLFELLSWATTGALGSHIEAVYRIWAVFPALAAAVALTWWLWRRLGLWPAAIFAVLAACAPNYLELSWQARGYGLGYLAGAIIIIGADGLLGRRSRSGLALLAGGGLIGILTLPVFVLPFLTVAGVLAWRRPLRRTMITTVIAVGLVSLAWYAPVLSSLISSARQQFGTLLPWDGFIVSLLKDQAAPLVTLAFSGASLNLAAAVAGVVIAIGALARWRAGDRVLVMLLLAPPVVTYLVLEIGRFYVADRFVSFLALPLLALGAVGLVALGRLAARGPWLAAVVVLVSVAGGLFLLDRAVRYGANDASRPYEADAEVALLIHGTEPPLPILTNSRRITGFQYYLGTRPVKAKAPAELERLFCTHHGAFLYIQDTNYSPVASVSCLQARGGFDVRLPERRATVALWYVPKLKG